MITEKELSEIGYEYLGEMGGSTKDRKANQLWRWRDELILYDPEEERIVWREFNEPRYQCDYFNQNRPVNFGRKEHK